MRRRRMIGAQMMTLCLLLAACSPAGQGGGSKAEELALEIRTEYIGMAGCTASMEVTADYGQRVYEYGMDLAWAKEGGTTLTLTAPEEVAGVTVRVEAGQTALEFDGARIETGALSEDGLSPIDAVPALLTAVKEGFMAECTQEDMDEAHTLRVCYRSPDTAPGTGTEVTIWFDAGTHALLRGEIAVDGFTAVQCTFTGFQMT